MSGTAASPTARVQPEPLAVRHAASAVLVVAVAALVGGDAAGRPGLAVAVIAVQLALVLAWFVLFRMQPDAALLVGAAVVGADVVLLRTRSATAGSIAGVVGVSVIVLLFHQLLRRDPRSVTGAICAGVSAVVLACGLGLLLPLRELAAGDTVIRTGLLAGGVAGLVARLLPGRSTDVGADGVRRLLALGAGLVVALLCGLPDGGLGVGDALGVGAGACGAALLADRVLGLIARPADPAPSAAQPFVLPAVVALVPLALASPIAYLAGRVIAGGAG